MHMRVSLVAIRSVGQLFTYYATNPEESWYHPDPRAQKDFSGVMQRFLVILAIFTMSK